MNHIFKLNGHRAALDCSTGTAHPLSALAMKIVETIEPPLTRECPTSLRYAFAKYDSRDLNDAYDEIYRLYEAGILFGDKKPSEDVSVYTEIVTSAEAASTKISSAIRAGEKHLIVTVMNATLCLASSLSDAYSSEADIHFILDLPTEALTDNDIKTANEAGYYIRAAGEFPDSVNDLAARGVRFIDAAIPATDSACKQTQLLAKQIAKEAENGTELHFAPFVFAKLPKNSVAAPICSNCCARYLCRGKCADTQEQCENVRNLLLCAAVLDIK